MPRLNHWKGSAIVSEEAFESLTLFVDLILEWNKKVNLTGFKTKEEIEEILFGESLCALEALHLAKKRVLDFGSGAGIPGLIWAICEPGARITSVEVRLKKSVFQKEVARATGLNAEIIRGRFPDAVLGRSFDVIVTRAIRFSPALWTEAEAMLAPGGCFVRFAGVGAKEEGWRTIPISARSSLLLGGCRDDAIDSTTQ